MVVRSAALHSCAESSSSTSKILPFHFEPSFGRALSIVEATPHNQEEAIITRIMSTDNNVASDMETSCCASCGVAGIDDVKLKKCNGCYLVRYCGIECQRDHWRHHKKECKKRAAELRDEILFKQPESTHRGDCPICMIPLPLDAMKTTITVCCSKVICKGCNRENQERETKGRLLHVCPFCRKPLPDTKKKADKLHMKRVEANDPVAIVREGMVQYSKGEYIKAFEYFTKAANLGDVEAHLKLALLYHHGHGVEKNKGKEIHHMEEAAIGGNTRARHNLGCLECGNGNLERAGKHLVIAANLGEDASIKKLTEMFRRGQVNKEDLDVALRGYQAAVNATRSPQREAADPEGDRLGLISIIGMFS